MDQIQYWRTASCGKEQYLHERLLFFFFFFLAKEWTELEGEIKKGVKEASRIISVGALILIPMILNFGNNVCGPFLKGFPKPSKYTEEQHVASFHPLNV